MSIVLYRDKQGGMWDTWYSADEGLYVAATVVQVGADDSPALTAETLEALRSKVESYAKAHPAR